MGQISIWGSLLQTMRRSLLYVKSEEESDFVMVILDWAFGHVLRLRCHSGR